MPVVVAPTQRYQQGDRVRVHKDIVTVPALPAYVGTVKEVIFCYTDQTIGYNLTIEDDPRPGRVWFFFQHQLRIIPRSRQAKQVKASK